jgi:hypothetical protein
MTIGTSILLIVVGAIFAFALQTEIPYISADAIGWILMIAGAVGLVIGLVLYSQRYGARRTLSTSVVQDEYGRERVQRNERIDGGAPPAGPGVL